MSIGKNSSKQNMLEYVRKIADELGYTLLRKDVDKSSIIRERFGTWNNVIMEAGLEPLDDYEQRNKRQEARKKYKEKVKEEYGEIPKGISPYRFAKMKKNGIQIPERKKKFGKVRLIGCPDITDESTDSEMIEFLQKMAEYLGFTPTKHICYNSGAIIRRFGSWEASTKAAGLTSVTDSEETRKRGRIMRRMVDEQKLS